jgi:predicted RNA-binding Zn ribbon-like protein
VSRQKTKPDSPSRDGFLFLGNQLALDFLNTRPVQNEESVELLPDFNALLRWFGAAGLLSSGEMSSLQEQWGKSHGGQPIVDRMRDLRENLRKAVLHWEGGKPVQRATIDQLNRLMAEHPMRTRLKMGEGAPSAELWFEPRQPEDLLAPLAYAAAQLFAHADRTRVRKCGHCVLHFHDTSKKGARRWCSMQLCGNRLKVAAYAARQRKQVS